jgi:hypothetical protein
MPITRPTKFSPDSLSRDEFAVLGRLIAWWGYLEYQIGVIVRVSCLKMSKEEQWLLLIGAEIKSLCGYLRTLAFSDHWIKDKAIRDDMDQFAKDLQDQAENRHAYVHALFGYVDDKPHQRVRHSFKPKGHRVNPGFEKISAASLKKMADDAQALWIRAQD